MISTRTVSYRSARVKTARILPTTPEAIQDCLRKEAMKDDPDIHFVSAILRAQRPLGDLVVTTINSAMYNLRYHISDIGHAVCLLGVRNVYNLLRDTGGIRQGSTSVES